MFRASRGLCVILSVLLLCGAARISAAEVYQKCFAYEAGPAGVDESAYGPDAGGSGAWAMITDGPLWGGPDASLVNPGWPNDIDGPLGFVFGPEDNMFIDDGDNSTNRHSWGLIRNNLSQVSGRGYTVLGDATLNFCLWWNHYHDGNLPRTYIPESAGLWEIPAGKIPNSNAPSQGAYVPAHEDPQTREWIEASQPWEDPAGFAKGFREASFNSITSNGSDMWLPIPGSPEGAVSLWDGNMTYNVDRDGQPGTLKVMTFTIPQAIVQRWLDDPDSYHGLVFGAAADDAQMRHGGIYASMDYMGEAFINNVNTLRFEYELAVPGDANGDGLVTDADYTIWADTYLSQTDLRADFSGDGQVTDADYTLWADHYSLPGGRVPGPAPGALLCICAIAWPWRRTQSRRLRLGRRAH